MRLLLYRGDGLVAPWAQDFARAVPGVETLAWKAVLTGSAWSTTRRAGNWT